MIDDRMSVREGSIFNVINQKGKEWKRKRTHRSR